MTNYIVLHIYVLCRLRFYVSRLRYFQVSDLLILCHPIFILHIYLSHVLKTKDRFSLPDHSSTNLNNIFIYEGGEMSFASIPKSEYYSKYFIVGYHFPRLGNRHYRNPGTNVNNLRLLPL